MLIVSSIITHVQETILPYLLKRPSPRRMMNKIAKRVHLDGKFRKKCLHGEVEHVDCLQPEDKVLIIAVAISGPPSILGLNFYKQTFLGLNRPPKPQQGLNLDSGKGISKTSTLSLP